MRAGIMIAGLACCVIGAAPTSAQQPTPQQQTTQRYTATTSTTPNRDVILEIPELSVDSIGLTVADVKAHVALDANAMNLVQITAGVDVGIKKVQLGIVGVLAEAYLYVDLDDVVYIVDQTLTFVDNHPEVVQQLGSTLQNTVGAVGGLVNRLLLGTVTNSLGQTVQRLIDQSSGSIIEKAVTGAGQAAAEKVVGNITQLPVISQATDASGNIVKRAKDAVTNAIVQYTLSKAGKLLTSSIISAATK